MLVAGIGVIHGLPETDYHDSVSFDLITICKWINNNATANNNVEWRELSMAEQNWIPPCLNLPW